MLIYSRWRPDGAYDYFQTQGFAALGNDLPNPVMPSPTQLGVPSVEVGHRLPSPARKVGSGQVAYGIVAPMDTSRVSGLQLGENAMFYMMVGGGFVALAWGAAELLRSRRPS